MNKFSELGVTVQDERKIPIATGIYQNIYLFIVKVDFHVY